MEHIFYSDTEPPAWGAMTDDGFTAAESFDAALALGGVTMRRFSAIHRAGTGHWSALYTEYLAHGLPAHAVRADSSPGMQGFYDSH